MREVRGCTRRVARQTTVILDPDSNFGVTKVGRYVGRGRVVNLYGLVGCDVVGGAGGHAEEVLVRHALGNVRGWVEIDELCIYHGYRRQTQIYLLYVMFERGILLSITMTCEATKHSDGTWAKHPVSLIIGRVEGSCLGSTEGRYLQR